MNKEKFLEIQDLIFNKNLKEIRKISTLYDINEFYEITENLNILDKIFLIRTLDAEIAADFFDRLEPEEQEEIIQKFSNNEVNELFENLFTNDVIDIIGEMPPELVYKILTSVDTDTRININKILKYDISSIGYHMHVDFVYVYYDSKINEARKLIKEQVLSKEKEVVGNIYVVDQKTKMFKGYITIDSILSMDDDDYVKSNNKMLNGLNPLQTMEEAQDAISEFDLNSFPVVSNGKIIGVIEAEDIIERLDQIDEATYESKKVKLPYNQISAFQLFKDRISWIVILLLIGTLTQIIITIFQSVWSQTGYWEMASISGSLIITELITLSFATAITVSSSINDTSGNTGSQTSSTLIRAIAVGEIRQGEYWKAIRKETMSGVYTGLTSSIVVFARTLLVWLMFGYLNTTDPKVWAGLILIASIASVSFFVCTIVGTFIGAVLPILSDKYNWDGAIISGPIQTTIVDIFTITFYFGLTTAIFVPLASVL